MPINERRKAAEEWCLRAGGDHTRHIGWLQPSSQSLAAHLAGQEHTIGRLREYQRALLWCYGLIQEEMSEANAEQIDDARWLDIKRLVGEASEEVEP